MNSRDGIVAIVDEKNNIIDSLPLFHNPLAMARKASMLSNSMSLPLLL